MIIIQIRIIYIKIVFVTSKRICYHHLEKYGVIKPRHANTYNNTNKYFYLLFIYKNVSISKFLSLNLFLDDDKIFPVDENILSLATDVACITKW